MRHIVKMVTNLPNIITQQITVTINDRDFDVVARNIILLLLALTTETTADAGLSSDSMDVVIHL
jgi:hypothetical protein